MPNTIPKDAKVLTGTMFHNPYDRPDKQDSYPYFAARLSNNWWQLTDMNTGETISTTSNILRNPQLASIENAVNSDVAITPYELKILQTAVQNNEYIGHGFHKGDITTYDFNEVKSNLPLSQPEGETQLVASGNVSLSPDYVVWNLDTNGTLTVYGNGAIPDFKEGDYRSWADCLKDVHTIKIEDGITRIGNNAFESFSIDTLAHDDVNCDNLVLVEVADSVKSIGEGAFENCANLRNVIVPNELDSIENSAFSGCENLQHVYIEDKATAMNPFPVPSEVHFISETAFLSCNKLEQPLIENKNIEAKDKIPELNDNVKNAVRDAGWQISDVMPSRIVEGSYNVILTPDCSDKNINSENFSIGVNFDGSSADFINQAINRIDFPADLSDEVVQTINSADMSVSEIADLAESYKDVEKMTDDLYCNLGEAQSKELENDLDDMIKNIGSAEKADPVKTAKSHSGPEL